MNVNLNLELEINHPINFEHPDEIQKILCEKLLEAIQKHSLLITSMRVSEKSNDFFFEAHIKNLESK